MCFVLNGLSEGTSQLKENIFSIVLISTNKLNYGYIHMSKNILERNCSKENKQRLANTINVPFTNNRKKSHGKKKTTMKERKNEAKANEK